MGCNGEACTAKHVLEEGREMSCNGEACTECTQICLSVHGKKKGASSITTFFKVMIGDDFSEILFLPPKFARTVPDLVGQKTNLEDINGRRWEATLSIVNGSMGFQQGWHDFSVDHGLEVGDFLVFHYITGSRFLVQIYGKSGCLKVDFPRNVVNQKKRTRSDRDSIAKAGPCQMSNKGSTDKQGPSPPVVSKSNNEMTKTKPHGNDVGQSPIATEKASVFGNGSEFAEEMCCCVFDRDVRYIKGEERRSLLDLSVFEMPRNDNKVVAVKERLPSDQTEAGLVRKDPVAKSNDSQIMEKVMLVSENNSGNSKIPRQVMTRSALKKNTAKNRSDGLATPKIVIKECQNAKGRGNSYTMKACKKEQVEMIEKSRYGQTPKIASECGGSRDVNITNEDKVCKVVKAEPVDSMETDDDKVFCLVSDDLTYLELPTCLPSITKARMRSMKKVVLLRDPGSGLWPLVYHDNHSFKTLASGWEAFCKGNNIHPGDKCVFESENRPECIYKVGVFRK